MVNVVDFFGGGIRGTAIAALSLMLLLSVP